MAIPDRWPGPVWLASDLHLSEELPRTVAAFVDWLEAARDQAGSVILLGDVFEVWVGDDVLDAPPAWLQPVMTALSALGRQRPLGWMAGNRDFLVGPRWLNAAGAIAMTDPSRVMLPDGPALLAHGDAWCTGDADYQQFRQQVRSTDWQQAFLARPLGDRMAEAARYRAASKARKPVLDAAIMDVTDAAVAAACEQAGCWRVIHGHTHRPDRHVTARAQGGRLERWVLSDWDLDDPTHPRAAFLEVDLDGPVVIDLETG